MLRTLLSVLCVLCCLAVVSAGTIDITSKGAKPNDGQDDSAAIQAAIDSASSMDTILIPEGVFDVWKPLQLNQDLWIKGSTTVAYDSNLSGVATDKSTLRAGGGNFVIESNRGKWLGITGVTLRGRGIQVDKVDVNGWIIKGNHLQYDGSTANWNNGAIFILSGVNNASITDNCFYPIQGDGGIFGYRLNKSIIARNTFRSGVEGIHIIIKSRDDADNVIEQNAFLDLHRMGIEYQQWGKRFVFQDDYYARPVMSTNFNDNDDTDAYSLIADGSEGMVVRRMTAIMPKSKDSPDKTGVRMIFEIGGLGTLVEQCYSRGGNHIFAINGTNGRGVIQYNNVGDFNIPALPSHGAQYTFGNNLPLAQWATTNNATTPLTWRIERGMPGPYHSVPVGMDPPGVPTPDPTPIPDPGLALDFSATPLDDPGTMDNRIRFQLGAAPQGIQSVTLECKSTSVGETGDKVGPTRVVFLPTGQFDVEGYHPGWKIDVRLNDKTSNKATPWKTVQMFGDSTVGWPVVTPPPPPTPVPTTQRVTIEGQNLKVTGP